MKKAFRMVSLVLVVCMVVMLCPLVSSADITYKTNHTGDKFTINNASNTADVTYEYGKNGIAGKAADDKIYYYSSTDANTGYGYFSAEPTCTEAVHDADSSVFEFSFLLEDENSAFYFSPAFYNDVGYEYFLANGELVATSGKGYFKSHNEFIRFSSNGIYIKKTGDDDYIASEFRNAYLSREPLETGVWHTAAIKLPGLINSKGEPKVDETGAAIDGAFAGGTDVLVYIDGEEFTIPLNRQVYGTRHIKLYGRGGMYLDNIRTYMTNQLANPSDYKNSVKYPEIKSDNAGIMVKDGVITYGGDVTVSQLKSAIKGADAIRVYSDDTYTALADDSAVVDSKIRVVAANKNGFSTEQSYAYYALEKMKPLEVAGVSLTDASGNEIHGTKLSSNITIPECYLDTTLVNNTGAETKPIRAIVASYDKTGAMIYYKSDEIKVQPGKLNISATENVHKFENIPMTENGKLKAFLVFAETGEPLCENFETAYGSDKEYHVLAIGNSYSGNSFTFLPRIANADGVKIYAVNMYIGGCPISTHYSRMKDGGIYDKRVEYFPDGTTNTTEDVTFADGLATPGYVWDYVTLHQKGQYSPFYNNYYTESKPYITELADHIRKNVNSSCEVLFFENWPVYTDRVTEKYDVYKSIVEGHEPEEYVDLVFVEIKSCYIKAAAQIGNPGRIIPAGEAVYRAVRKYGFAEYVKDPDTGKFVGSARAMFADDSSHMTSPYGQVLVALTWYEYLTGNDARENKYTHSKIPANDMKLLKEIAHEVCQLPEYNPAAERE